MPQAEIVPDALTATVDEIDQEIVRLLQRAVNAILEVRGPEWLEDAWMAVTMGGFRGVMRMVVCCTRRPRTCSGRRSPRTRTPSGPCRRRSIVTG